MGLKRAQIVGVILEDGAVCVIQVVAYRYIGIVIDFHHYLITSLCWGFILVGGGLDGISIMVTSVVKKGLAEKEPCVSDDII